MTKTPEIDSEFARWYAEAFMDDGARRNQRWKGVVDVAASQSDHRAAEVLTRLAFQTPVPASGRKNEDLTEVYEVIISSISGGDVAFDPSQSERELQILSAAALTRLFKSIPDAALSVSTASFGGVRRLNLPMDLAGLAEVALVELSSRKHRRADISELKLAAPKIEFAVTDEAIQSMDAAQWKQEFDRLHAATGTAIGRVVSGQNRVIANLHRQSLLDQEELQMLWWLIGGHSRYLGKSFSEIDGLIKPLMLAQELGEMTTTSPGPASIRAMFSRANISKDEVKVADAVNAVGVDWAKKITNSKSVSPATTPIHFALEQRAELGSADTWKAGWSTLTGLAVDVSLPSILLAELFYREHLFLFVSE
jgi:hypothetical protein